MTEITRAQKRICAARELVMRERVYPGWVRSGRMTKQQADHEIAVMRAIAEDYRAEGLFDKQGGL